MTAAPRQGIPIEAERLVRRFGAREALAGVDLRIAPGEAFGLLGANGAGKTTFIRCLTGWLLPSSGVVRVDGISPADDPDAVHERLGFVPETSRLYPDLRVRGFLRFAAAARGLAGAARDTAVDRALAELGLEEVAGRLVGNLSKGYQQRVSLAQAFLHDPPLLVVDEPTGGLDPLQQAEVRRLLRAAAGRRTLLVCTHDLAEARTLCDRVAVLSAGRVVALGAAEELLGGPDPLALFTPEARA
ncbi:MAG TPA: ABC transporter ATP-binding protein [Myxococcota bacterium]|nr:ABC transporter ATP-binding protein [Myxococcota bacterium]